MPLLLTAFFTEPFVSELQKLSLLGIGAIAAYAWKKAREYLEKKTEKRAKVTDLQYLSAKTIELNRYAQFMLDKTGCDHVSIYAAANGEYLKSGDSIEKFIMQAEACDVGQPHYLDIEPLIYANTIPSLISQIFVADYVLMWPEKSDDHKVNAIMRQRGYSSSVAMLITIPSPHGRFVLGLAVLSWKQIVLHPLRSQLPQKHSPFETYITLQLQQAITKFKLEISDLLDNKRD